MEYGIQHKDVLRLSLVLGRTPLPLTREGEPWPPMATTLCLLPIPCFGMHAMKSPRPPPLPPSRPDAGRPARVDRCSRPPCPRAQA